MTRGLPIGTVSPLSTYVMPKGYTVVRVALIAVVLVLLGGGASAEAHPLGNFSVNHLSTVSISADRVEVRYVLDQAEIPTVQERGLGRAEVLRRKLDEIQGGLSLTVNGRAAELRPAGGPEPLRMTGDASGAPRITFPDGAGGLATTRLELTLNAAVENPSAVTLTDNTFPGRVGWKAIVAAPGEATAVRTNTPSGDPTRGLRTYPQGLLDTPRDEREAHFSVTPGTGTLVAPQEPGGEAVKTDAAATSAGAGAQVGGAGSDSGSAGADTGSAGAGTGSAGADTGGAGAQPGGADAEGRGRSDGFAGLFEDAAAGRGVLALMLLAALGWGALHALSPGHGKAMVAAYLIGTRGSSRDALVLGATVTITHTIGVFALGLVTLGLSQYVLPEQLYPWLTLISGLMVVAVGAGVLRSRLRRSRGHEHANGHEHAHGHGRGHAHPHRHPHGHAQAKPDALTNRGLLGMGFAAGLLPCPSALVVLLAAISQHEVALGMLLIVAFSVGLAGTLTVLGLAVVHARRLVPPRVAVGRLAALLPAVSAVVVVALGLVLAAAAVPDVV